MTQRYRHHADHIVQNFRQALHEAQDEAANNESYELLALQIESAISTAALTEVEALADQIDDFAANVRKRSERFDTPQTATESAAQ